MGQETRSLKGFEKEMAQQRHCILGRPLRQQGTAQPEVRGNNGGRESGGKAVPANTGSGEFTEAKGSLVKVEAGGQKAEH